MVPADLSRVPSPATLLVLASLARAAAGHALPRQTKTVELRALDVRAWPPQPTPAPALAGELLLLLLPRQLNTVCGYIGGDPSQPATCSAGSYCAVDADAGAIGCCPDGGACTQGIFTGCVDVNSPPQTEVNPYVFTCTGSNVCYKNTFDGGFFQYGCGSASSLATHVAATASGQSSLQYTTVKATFSATPTSLTKPTTIGSKTGTVTTRTSTSKKTTTHTSTTHTSTTHTSTTHTSTSHTSTSHTSTSKTTTSKSSSTRSTTSSSTTTTANLATSAPKSDNNNNSSNTAAIVGGTVGGVIALIAILAFLFWLWRRRRGNSRQGPGLDQETRYVSPVNNGHMFEQLPVSMSRRDRGMPRDPPRAYGMNAFENGARGQDMPHDSYSHAQDLGPMQQQYGAPYEYGHDMAPGEGMAVGGSPTRMEPDQVPLTREIDEFSQGFNTALGDIREDDEPASNAESMSTYPARRGDGGRPLWQQNRRQSRNLMWM